MHNNKNKSEEETSNTLIINMYAICYTTEDHEKTSPGLII